MTDKEWKQYTRFRRRLVGRLREAGEHEVAPGKPANVLADEMELDLAKETALVTIHRSLEAVGASVTAVRTKTEACLLPGALDVFHTAKRLAPKDPTGQVAEAVKQMQHALRREQHHPRGRRRKGRVG